MYLFVNVSFLFKSSINENAKKYTTRHSLVFYPDSEYCKKYAKNLAKSIKDDSVYDYSLVPYGDYYLVSYGNDLSFFTDKDFNEIQIGQLDDDGKRIISDYLRYEAKKNKPELYYTKSFLNDSYVDNLDFENLSYEIEDEYLKCRFTNYDFDVLVPLKYIQKSIDMNFGYKDELYIKPTYISDIEAHPVICLTFDDGPLFWYEPSESSSVSIVDTLYRYDACGTFFVVGDCLEDRSAWTDYEVYSFLKQSINNGNEYGSHTAHHDYLPDLAAEEVKKVISNPNKYLYDLVGYNMKLYRPPEGVFDEAVSSASPYPAILWSDDSDDWDLEDSEAIYERMKQRQYYNGDILLFHEIYDESAEALKKIVPDLIERGYQLLTVSDMFKAIGIDENKLTYYYNLNPSPYFE